MKSRHFATTLRREMNARGWTQTELASRAHCTQPAISQLLSGRRSTISLEMAVRLASAMDAPLETLAGVKKRVASPGPGLRAAQRWLLNPPAGSLARKAKDFGIDLSLNAELLALSLDERLASLAKGARFLEQIERGRIGTAR